MTGSDHPTTLLLCVHKGASTFLAGGFAKAVCREFAGLQQLQVHFLVQHENKTLEDLKLPPQGVLATRVYPVLYDEIIEDPVPAGGRFADKKLIMLRRDPRDAAVSLYYSHAYSHPVIEPVKERFLKHRENLQQLTVAEGIRKFAADVVIDEFLATARFLERYPQVCLTTYETLVTDFDTWFTTVSQYLGWPKEKRDLIKRGMAEQLAPPKEVDPSKHVRRVTPGNWREVFDEELSDYFKSRLGSDLGAAGYEW